MNLLIGLLGVAIFAAAIYGIVKHQKSTPSGGGSGGGYTGGGYTGGGELETRPGDNPKGDDTNLVK